MSWAGARSIIAASSLRHAVVACCAVLLSFGQHAAANGRFPRAQRLLEDPRDPSHLILTATYGLLVTTDRGAAWHHVCEAAYGETDLTTDALTAFTREGVLLAGIYSGVSRAATDTCDFQRVLGLNNREAVPDFALALSMPGRVLAVQVAIPEDGEPYSRLYRSDDDGLTWRPLGDVLPRSLRTPLTIEIAPSDADRVYLSGLGENEEGVLLRSDDGGQSFEELEIPTDAARFEAPYIVAVDPEDADRLYVRTDSWLYDAQTNSAIADDALLYSVDAGGRFAELLRAPGKLFGFAFSPDSSELLLGYGDPREAGGSRYTDPAALGIYRAAKGSSDFDMRYAGSVGCVTWSERGIYVCTDERETGFSLGLFETSSFDVVAAVQVEPLLMLADVAGPIECAACATGAVCASYWLSTCQSWGRMDCDERVRPVCLPDGGAGGATSEAAAGAAEPNSGGAGDWAGQSSLEPIAARGGCACRGGPASANSWTAALLVLLIGARRRSLRHLRSCRLSPRHRIWAGKNQAVLVVLRLVRTLR
jgi:MYXO-CTERM domain-containing protein